MNLLTDGVNAGAVIKTEMSKKLMVDGIMQTYPVYKVRLDLLFFNDQNDRISTWISEYKNAHDGNSVDLSDIAQFNEIIESFIVKSNPEAIKKTQTNIEIIDQRESGVVLDDGRVIDGNRRFACLRRLSAKNQRFNHFETIILDINIEKSAKQIKMLELSIQHGEESKVDYNSIDRLVGVYNDIIDTKLLTPEEYAKSSNEDIREVNKRIEVAKLMVDFLEFINAPLQFHLAREMGIYSPIEELNSLLKKCQTNDEAENVKNCVFTNILMRTEGDMRQFVRGLKKIVGSEYQEDFLQEQNDIAEKVLEKLPDVGKVTDQFIRDELRTNEDIVQELDNSLEKSDLKVKKTEIKNRPIQYAEKATNFLEGIDTGIIRKLNDSELRRFERQLNRIENVIAEIKGCLYNA